MSINTGMKELIKSVNQLQAIAAKTKLQVGWQLPQIVVVGGQSVGKSSVLESFFGRDFLPRGSGICTRRPLILQLQTFDGQSYACFGHDQKEYTDFDEVRKEIERETDRLTGSKISNQPILLKVFSPEVLDLTLVDLPGLVKVPVGDQPGDIEQQIEAMILEFIAKENSIILAVTPANTDLANSDAIKLARMVDPDGKRTIGVMTKLDLMDEGTDARDIFEGKENRFALKKGYVGMVNRSQKDITSNCSIQDAIANENKYFKTSPYQDMMNRMGTKVLQQLLNKELHNHIMKNIPSIKRNLLNALQSNEESLKDLGYGGHNGERGPREKATTLIIKFGHDVAKRFHGNGDGVYGDKVTGGAIIGKMYYTDVTDEINRGDEEITEEQIEIWSANYAGTTHGNHLDHNDRVVYDAVKELTPRYIKHLENCVDMVKDQVEKTVANAADTIFNGHPFLIQEVLDLMNDQIMKNQRKTKDLLKSFAEVHASFTNLNHPDFIATKNKNEYVYGDAPADRTADDMTKSSSNTNIKEQTVLDKCENEEICRGPMSLLTTGALSTSNKDVLVVLYRNTLVIYSTTKNKEINRITMDGCNVNSMNDPKIGGTRFTIYRLNRRMIQKEKCIEFVSNFAMEDQWIEAFKEIGVYQKETKYSSTLSLFPGDDQPERKKSPTIFGKIFKKESSRGKDHDGIAKEPQYVSAAKRFKPLIKIYMNILNVAFLDTTPKYIEKILVKGTVDFAKEYLLSEMQGRLLSEEHYAKILDSYDEEKNLKKQKITDLVESCAALKEALGLECFSKI